MNMVDAINLALKKAKTDFFSVLDADSRIDQKSIKILMSNFEDPNVGAAISRIKVDVPKKLIERIQRFEYIMSTLLRKVMSALGTLAMTPGVLSMYNTKILKKIGGFVKDDNNLTEDLEVALRLRKNGYSIALEHKSITYTCAPNTIKELWNQRIRWSRGYIYNHWNYRKMFFSKEHGLFGVFQLPINLVAILFLVINILIISIMFIRETTELVIRSLTIEGYFMNYITDIPTLKDYFLSLNIHIILPLIVAAFLGFYMIYSAHKQFKERVRKNVIPMVAYFLFIPYFLTVNWVISLIKEIFRFKRSW